MFAKIKQFLGIGLFSKPMKRVGPFEAARRDVAEREYESREALEERERRWEAKRRCLGGNQ